MNASEASSFLYFFPVAAASLLIPSNTRRIAVGAVDLALLLFCVAALWFQGIGFGSTLAEWSLWGRVLPVRVDLSLGLASVLWCSVRLGAFANVNPMRPQHATVLAAAIVWAALVTVPAMRTPEAAVGALPNWLLVALPFGVFALSWALLTKRATAFLGGLLVVQVLTAFAFNPIVRAPSFVQATPAWPDLKGSQRLPTLVVGYLTGASALLAAGLPTVNGVFYYPPRSLWDALDPDHAQESVWNRYQHLSFEPMAAGTTDPTFGYRIEKKGDDAVRVAFDPDRFDFRLVKAERVLAPAALDLSRNPHLAVLLRGGGQTLYEVRP